MERNQLDISICTWSHATKGNLLYRQKERAAFFCQLVHLSLHFGSCARPFPQMKKNTPCIYFAEAPSPAPSWKRQRIPRIGPAGRSCIPSWTHGPCLLCDSHQQILVLLVLQLVLRVRTCEHLLRSVEQCHDIFSQLRYFTLISALRIDPNPKIRAQTYLGQNGKSNARRWLATQISKKLAASI